MAGTVTAHNLTRITDAENTGVWSNLGGGTGSGFSQDFVVQNLYSRGIRVDNGSKGMNYDNGVGIDLSGADDHVGMWIGVTSFSALTTAQLVIGDGGDLDAGNVKAWNVLTSANYPSIGGWVKVFVDVSSASDGAFASGTLSLTSVRGFGSYFTIADIGGNVYNCYIDSIEHTSGSGGLLINAGTVPSPAVFDDFSTFEAIAANGYGVVIENNRIKFVQARLIIADATATVFNDSGFVIVFPDQTYCSTTFMGITVDLQNASTDVNWTGGVIQSAGTTRRGDILVTGTSGSFSATSMTLAGVRIITLTSACTVSSSSVNSCGTVTVGGGLLTNVSFTDTISTSASAVSNLSELSICNFKDSTNSSYAVDLGTVSTTVSMTWTCTHEAADYVTGTSGNNVGVTPTGNEVILVNVASGQTLTINVGTGASVPSVANSGSGQVNVLTSYTLTLTGIPSGVNVTIVNSATRVELQHSTSTGAAITYVHGGGETVDILLMGLNYDPNVSDIYDLTLGNEDQSIPFSPIDDLNYENP